MRWRRANSVLSILSDALDADPLAVITSQFKISAWPNPHHRASQNPASVGIVVRREQTCFTPDIDWFVGQYQSFLLSPLLSSCFTLLTPLLYHTTASTRLLYSLIKFAFTPCLNLDTIWLIIHLWRNNNSNKLRYKRYDMDHLCSFWSVTKNKISSTFNPCSAYWKLYPQQRQCTHKPSDAQRRNEIDYWSTRHEPGTAARWYSWTWAGSLWCPWKH